MPLTVEQIYEEALQLPNESRVLLAERLVESLETTDKADIEGLHLEIAKRRRDDLRSGKVQPIEGESGLHRVRKAIGI